MLSRQFRLSNNLPTHIRKYRSSPNPDLLCIQQSDAAPFCENYAKLYFDAKHLEK